MCGYIPGEMYRLMFDEDWMRGKKLTHMTVKRLHITCTSTWYLMFYDTAGIYTCMTY